MTDIKSVILIVIKNNNKSFYGAWGTYTVESDVGSGVRVTAYHSPRSLTANSERQKMLLSQLEETIPALYYASCEDGGAVPLILSAPGRGKTSVAKKFPRIMKGVNGGDYGFVEINGSTLNLGTMGGYLQFGPTVNGKPTSMFSLPWWWWADGGNVDKAKRLLEEFDGGIICIDEADKVGPDEAKSTGEAAFAKVWMTHAFPPGWVVWFLGNRIQDRAGSNKQFSHLINRQMEIQIRDDTESWVNWAESAHLLAEIKSFGQDFPWLFQEMPKDLAPWCTPRSLHQVEIFLRAYMKAYDMDKIPVTPMIQELIGGSIGGGAARDLIKHIRDGQDLPTYAEVIANPRTVTVPQKPDGKRLMAYRISDGLTMQDVGAALQYMDRYGDEFQAIFARMAIHNNYEFMFDPEFDKWCDNKSHLIALVERYKNASKQR